MSLRLRDQDLSDAWAELTPLTSDDPPQVLVWEHGAQPPSLARVPEGPVMICRGAAGRATTCASHFLHPGDAIEIDFEPGSRVTGACFEAGEPAIGAHVAVVPLGLSTPHPFTLPLRRDRQALVRRVETGKDGSFSVPELGPGDYFLEITFPSGRLDTTEPFTIPRRRPEGASSADPAPTPVLDLGPIRIDSGLAVEFAVTDLWGLPLAGAEVGGGQGSGPQDWTVFLGHTDEEGRAVVSGFKPDLPLQLTCRAPGFEPSTYRFDTPPGWVDCALPPLVGLEGRVVDPEGEPIHPATVSLAGGRAQAMTDETGLFRFSELTAREHELIVAAPGYQAETLEVALSPRDELHRVPPVVLRPAPNLSGLVRDRETLEPVAGAVVQVLSPPGGGRTASDPDGEFTLAATSASGLRLAVSAPGFAARRIEVSPERLAGDEPLVVDLSRGGRIQVRVWSEEEGGPCQGCTVWFGGPSSGRLVTGEEGEAFTEPLDPGTYTLQRPDLLHRGSQAVVQGGREVRSVTVRPAETTLVELGERVAFQTLVFSPPPPVGWKLAAESPTRYDAYWPEADGSFRVQRRVDEPLTLSLTGPSGPGGLDSTVLLGTLPPDPSPGTETLHLPDTAARGIVERGEEPVPAARVELVSATDGQVWARTQALDGGRFELSHVPPGTYLLRIEGQVVRTLSLSRGDRSELQRVEIP